MTKEERRIYRRNYRAKNPEKFKAYQRKWAALNWKRLAIKNKEWRAKQPKLPKVVRDYRLLPLDLKKIRARALVRTAVSNGTLPKESCEICSNPEVDAHHDDYTKPYSVRWLCVEHHKEHHRNSTSLGSD